jgi:hypothetical protein
VAWASFEETSPLTFPAAKPAPNLSKNFRKAERAEKAIAEAKKYYDLDLEAVQTGKGRYELRLKAEAFSPTTADCDK